MWLQLLFNWLSVGHSFTWLLLHLTVICQNECGNLSLASGFLLPWTSAHRRLCLKLKSVPLCLNACTTVETCLNVGEESTPWQNSQLFQVLRLITSRASFTHLFFYSIESVSVNTHTTTTTNTTTTMYINNMHTTQMLAMINSHQNAERITACYVKDCVATADCCPLLKAL